jgi:hypothetical protein
MADDRQDARLAARRPFDHWEQGFGAGTETGVADPDRVEHSRPSVGVAKPVDRVTWVGAGDDDDDREVK